MTVRLFNACSTAGTTDTLAEHWNGTQWNLQTTPNPAAGKINGLPGVACTLTGTCVAVGSLWNGTQHPEAGGTPLRLGRRGRLGFG